LLVRDVDDTVVQALKKRAGAHGHSQGAELRAILSRSYWHSCRMSVWTPMSSARTSKWQLLMVLINTPLVLAAITIGALRRRPSCMTSP
jgi:hypothetical protein